MFIAVRAISETLRIPFATAAALVLVLWFLAPLLRVALLSAS